MAQQAVQPAKSNLRLDEMTRILDVAAELHAREEIVEQQLHLETVKDDLRRRLLAGAAAAGEPLTAEQVDVAIDQYYDNLHAYADPPRSFQTLLANIYVRIGWQLPLLVAAALAAWLAASILI